MGIYGHPPDQNRNGDVEPFKAAMEAVGTGIDAAGVAVIVAGAVYASAVFLIRRAQPNAYTLYRQTLGRAILLGLEFLVAGDIIRTVAVSPTLPNVVVLGAIVLIRTFLSTSLQLEIEGSWPWQKQSKLPPSANG
jgi:uncharacterized membrane protein